LAVEVVEAAAAAVVVVVVVVVAAAIAVKGMTLAATSAT
jgi:hypothetical protein